MLLAHLDVLLLEFLVRNLVYCRRLQAAVMLHSQIQEERSKLHKADPPFCPVP